MEVPDRSNILFHKGNVPLRDSKGCILVGEQFQPVYGMPAVARSGEAFSELMAKYGDAEFTLLIEKCM